MKTLTFLIAATFAAIPVTASAASVNERIAVERFKAADANKDGKLTKAEAKNGMPRIHANFDRIDTAKRGFLTLAQIKAVIAAVSN